MKQRERPKLDLVLPDEKAAGDPRELERLARWMDSVFEIPVLGLRFGLDALLGLLPGGGDLATTLVSVYILSAAHRHGVSRATLVRMTSNIAIDLVIGAIPILGDVFDAYWKANQRNVELLRRHLTATPAAERKLRRSDRMFVVLLVVLLLLLLVGSVVAAYLTFAWLLNALRTSSV